MSCRTFNKNKLKKIIEIKIPLIFFFFFILSSNQKKVIFVYFSVVGVYSLCNLLFIEDIFARPESYDN